RPEVDEIRHKRAWPDDVDHEDVEVGRLTLEEPLVLGKRIGRALRARNDVDVDARLLLELGGSGFVQVVPNADAITVIGERCTAERLGGGGILNGRWIVESEAARRRGRGRCRGWRWAGTGSRRRRRLGGHRWAGSRCSRG